MGCRVSSQESLEPAVTTNPEMFRGTNFEIDFKARLERKQVLVRSIKYC